MKTSKGFTLIELLIAVFAFVFVGIVVCYLGIAGALIMGNQWFTEDGALRTVQVNHPDAVRVMDAERNVFRHSVITIEHKNGGRGRYCLDSDIMFNYTITACDK